MNIITFSAIKGGVGKTTLTFNYGEWLAQQGYNVLMVDSDHQCSLTQTYDIFANTGTVENIFSKEAKNVDVIELKENLSLIAGSMNLDLISNDLQTRANKELLMYMWLKDNYDRLKSFDYVLIDTHPDFSTITQNMIAVSDTVISPIEPSEYGFISKDNLDMRFNQLKKEVINVMTRESFITAELKFVGNRIKHNTQSSKEFVNKMQEDERTIAFFPERELMNKSTLTHVPLVDMKNDTTLTKSNRDFIETVEDGFETILKNSMS